ncbi:MAG: hypothetical protein KA401_02085 [Anaerolineae bacterium]|nr:hypothetical protein [Chloroflexota bacterium]MBP6298109.1 hypothetical protein [Anaerolineae bacterium]
MPSPGLIFAFVMATLYGALFHLVLGGDARRLALFLLAGWLGFALGHILGVVLGIEIFSLGGLRMLAATVGSFFTLFAMRALTTGQRRRRTLVRG